jgi:hypothetical protein
MNQETLGQRLLNPVKEWFKPTTDMFDQDTLQGYRNTDMNPYTLEENQQDRKYGSIRKPSTNNTDLLMRGIEGGLGMLDFAADCGTVKVGKESVQLRR